MSNIVIPMLDNGHSGLILGEYQTAGKRSPRWDKGVLYEGMFNRDVVNRLKWELYEEHNYPYYHVSPEDIDVPLYERVHRANEMFMKHRDKNFLFLSIHANAGGGRGTEIYTSRGETKADAYATILGTMWQEYFKEMPLRKDFSDGDLDKEANFYVLRKTFMPAILLEVGFMDNKYDYHKMWDDRFRQRVAEMLAEFIINLKP